MEDGERLYRRGTYGVVELPPPEKILNVGRPSLVSRVYRKS